LARGFLQLPHRALTTQDGDSQKMAENGTEATTITMPRWLPFWLLFVYLQRIFKCLPRA